MEYVRVCTAYGAGFFYIPGTDTCLRVEGYAQFAYQFTQTRTAAPDKTGFRAQGRIALDGRTDTAYGTLRTFIRFDMRDASGAYLSSGTARNRGQAFSGFGQDIGPNRHQTYVELDKAFIQFAGFTAGRANSFFDFYASAGTLGIGSPFGSNENTNLLAYTATFGGGWSATVSMEDPIWRRQPVFANGFAIGGNLVANTFLPVSTGGTATLPAAFQTSIFNNILLGVPVASVPVAYNAAGVPEAYRNLDVAQRNSMPDLVANIRLDQPWGSAQISGAVHEVMVGRYVGGPFSTGLGGAGTGALNAAYTGTVNTLLTAETPSAEYGYAVQGGVKLNLPMIAAGDVLYLQAAWAHGASAVHGPPPPGWGREPFGQPERPHPVQHR